MELCRTCESWPEGKRCPDCGMTGPEIYAARFGTEAYPTDPNAPQGEDG